MAAGKPCRKNYEEMFEEWNAEFPFLKRYSPTTMYERVGPFVMGLRLEKYEDKDDQTGYPNYYRLFYEIIPLWTADPKEWGVKLFDELKIEKRRGLRKVDCQAWVKYWRHDQEFEETVAAANRQYGKVIGPEIKLKDMVDFIEAAYKRMSLKNVSDRASVLELELGLGVYADSSALINEVWRKIDEERTKWDIDLFEYLRRYSVDDWVRKMHEFADNRAGMMANIEQNLKRPRVASLNVGKFVDIEDYPSPLTWIEKLKRHLSKA